MKSLLIETNNTLKATSSSYSTHTAWSRTGSNYYSYSTNLVIWSDAQAACMATSPSSMLASVHSSAENAFIYSLAPQTTATRWLGAQLIRTNVTQTPPFIYSWSDNTPYNYNNFSTGNPTDGVAGNQNCVQMGHPTALILPGQWTSVQCSLKRAYVCERPGLRVFPSFPLSLFLLTSRHMRHAPQHRPARQSNVYQLQRGFHFERRLLSWLRAVGNRKLHLQFVWIMDSRDAVKPRNMHSRDVRATITPCQRQ